MTTTTTTDKILLVFHTNSNFLLSLNEITYTLPRLWFQILMDNQQQIYVYTAFIHFENRSENIENIEIGYSNLKKSLFANYLHFCLV